MHNAKNASGFRAKRAWFPSAVSLLLLLFGLVADSASANTVILDKVVAIVDEDVILKSELDGRVGAITDEIVARKTPLPSPDLLRQQVLERLILERLQLQMADRAGVHISDEELNHAMSSIASQNRMTLQQFQQALEQQGISYQETREQVRNELKINTVQQGVMRSRIHVTDQEISNFLESDTGATVTADEYRVAHILVAVDADAPQSEVREARHKVEEILAQARNGADFQQLAVAHSDGQHALEGGDLGWRKAIELPSLFAAQIEKMQVGEIAGPIRSGSGFHLIKLADKRGARAEGNVAQTRVRHVLIKPSEIRSDQEAKELAESLLAEVRAGRDFEEVARLHSEDPGSALSGGDLGWNAAGAFAPEFEAVEDAMEVNQISNVFRTQEGYDFLQVTGRRVQDFSKEFLRNQAANYLRSRKFEEELDNWLREIRAEGFVQIKI